MKRSMGSWRALAASLALAFLAACAPARGEPAPFSQWAAIVVAGDDHASHTSRLTETFDNARRDLAAAFVAKGFSSANVRQFSLRPDRYPGVGLLKSDAQTIEARLRELAAHATGGCLVYFTSHGTRAGVVVGETLLSPIDLARIVDGACPARPTVVIVSACYSGAFVPALKKSGRMVFTAARRDRSSFGCSESDKYPFFDDCMLRALPAAAGFAALGQPVRACVASREREMDQSPPSQPQFWLAGDFRAPKFEDHP
jgi:hypothetical protein